MDMDFITEGVSEDDFFRFEENNQVFEENNQEYSNFDGERCGICMDIVIDRGVLDCCQHWFCFTCIDNWASITNLCPLCQQAFQSITCVPVYDTIGGDKLDEDSYSRDDDWSIEGTNNTLSFPSYYIDESAVICLDGDGCKMRSESEATKTNSNLDTSIACDSCDVWYHAFCVGFDPEGSSENSWLCPRCLVDEVPQEPDHVSASIYMHQQQTDNATSDCSNEGDSSGKMLVSVADDGETAVVVSRVQVKQEKEELCANQSILNMLKEINIEALLSGLAASSMMSDFSGGAISREPCLEPEKNEGPLSENTCSNLPIDSLAQSDFLINIDNQGKEEQNQVDLPIDSSAQSDFLINNDNQGKEEYNQVDPQENLSTNHDSFVDGGDEAMTEQSKELPVSNVLTGEKEGIVSVTNVKRKHVNYRNANNGKSKARVNGKSNQPKPNMKGTDSRPGLEKKEVAVDIMDIVQGTDERRFKKLAATNTTISSSKERDSTAGLRVKKIMRRTSDDIVQNLRKEIRDAVGNKSSKDIGENLFDPKLLAAFRAVVAVKTVETETETKKPHVDLRAKKAMFQKGKVRENLTKKIYGMGGRRKRAWTRDCEIEFWKHRCLKVSKPEKIQTLQSVLSLLRNDTDDRIIKRRKDGESTNPLLSRLYLADTSLLPRKDDIKPVLSQNSIEIPQKSDLSANNAVTSSNLSSEKTISVVKSENPSTKLSKNKGAERTPLSGSGGSQEKIGVTDVKTDKRKWALEVLARKTAVTTQNVGQEDNKGDSTILKGNFPQLALIPKDMRPILASANHNKIPTAVRQTQLYRIAENFLKSVKLPEMLRSAETELAVADAVNVEKDIADRSNSKVVYTNLCSQELLRRSHSRNNNETRETSISQARIVAPPDKTEVTIDDDDDSLDPEINEALRNAGLLSDTPPSSPHDEPTVEIMNVLENMDDDDNGPDNIFELDSQRELDIYGDFEYNLEDEDFIGATTLKPPSQIQEEEESKLKLVFSTLCDDDKSKKDSPENIQEASTSNENRKNIGGDTADDDGSRFQNPALVDDESKELSVIECEQLYGPDKEPLFAKDDLEMVPDGAGHVDQLHQELTENDSRAHVNAVANKESDERTDDANANKGSNSPGHERILESDERTNDADANANANANANKGSDSPVHERKDETNINGNANKKSDETNINGNANKKSDGHPSVKNKVEAYIKEHIRPLCKSGVITVEQYRWSIKKTSEKVMKYHYKDKNANFLVKEGEKVKKLAEQYVEAAQQQMPKSLK